MKNTWALLITFLLFIPIGIQVLAEQVPLEKPEIKIYVDGTQIKGMEPAIMLNDRTLVPFRTLLINLGVENDDNHIKWDQSKKSITVLKGDTTISLNIGNPVVTINGKTDKFDISPVLYKDKSYIPVRLVAEALGKTVFWYDLAKSIVITDKKMHEQMMSIYNKSIDILKNTKNFRMMYETNITWHEEDMKKFDYTFTSDAEFLYCYVKNYDGSQHDFTEYYINNKNIICSPAKGGKWDELKNNYPVHSNRPDFDDGGYANLLEEYDIASLTMKSDENNYIFEGRGRRDMGPDDDGSCSYYEKIVFDKATNRIIDRIVKINNNVNPDDKKYYDHITYEYYNDDFKLDIPNEVLELAQNS